MTLWVGPAITAVSLVGLLIGERLENRTIIWIFKPLASAGFMVAAYAWGGLETTYGRVMLGGLFLCLLGDVLLIPDGKRTFLAGLVAFLLGHLAYAAAFVVGGVLPMAVLAALAVLVVPRFFVLRWLSSRVERDMQTPVQVYASVITVMLAFAIGSVAFGRPWTIGVGATAFYLSDLSVAANRLVSPSFLHRLWGLPLYYAAQLMLAFTVLP